MGKRIIKHGISEVDSRAADLRVRQGGIVERGLLEKKPLPP